MILQNNLALFDNQYDVLVRNGSKVNSWQHNVTKAEIGTKNILSNFELAKPCSYFSLKLYFKNKTEKCRFKISSNCRPNVAISYVSIPLLSKFELSNDSKNISEISHLPFFQCVISAVVCASCCIFHPN